MDGTHCPQCGQPGVAGDRFCRQCGAALAAPAVATAPAPTAPPKKEKGCARPILLTILAAVLVIWIGMALGNGGSSTPRVYSPDPISAYVMCKEFVSQRLKAPSSAEFASYGDTGLTQVTPLGGSKFQVDSFVDADNAFGAHIRIAFACQVTNTGGDNWRLDKLSTSED